MPKGREAKEINFLKSARDQIHARLVRLGSFIDAETCPDDVSSISIRFETLKECWTDFKSVQSNIDAIEGSTNDEWETFEDLYYSLHSKYSKVMNSFAADLCDPNDTDSVKSGRSGKSHSSNFKNTPRSNPSAKIKLPAIQLPTFSGSYEEFQAFMELFNSLIESNQSLPIIQKFHFLRTSLKGEAAAVIQSLELSEANYYIALELLKCRYDNPRILINQHIQSLFNVDRVEKEKATSLRLFLDTSIKHIRALGSLGEPIETWGTLLIYILSNKLDASTRKAWEIHASTTDNPSSLNTFSSFIQTHCRILEACQLDRASSSSSAPSPKTLPRNSPRLPYNVRSSSYVALDSKGHKIKCSFCSEAHYTYKCPDFLKLTIHDRIKLVDKLKLCRNCFWSHKTIECKSNYCCLKCGKRHNSLIHYPSDSQQPLSSSNLGSSSQPASKASITSCSFNSCAKQQIVLATALVNILNSQGEPVPCRILLDSASQSNFVTSALSDSLGLPKSKCDISIHGISNKTTKLNHSIHATIMSRTSPFKISINFHVIPKITENIPLAPLNVSGMHIPPNVILADPNFYAPQKIDALVGAEVFWSLMNIGQHNLGRQFPVLQNTKFGWILSGKLQNKNSPNSVNCFLAIEPPQPLEELISKFWDIEEINEIKSPSLQEEACEVSFLNNTYRDSSGRFHVSLPFSKDPNSLGDSRETALRRFLNLERRFLKNPSLKERYSEFLNDYLQLDHMEEVDAPLSNPVFYLPHHPVFKESSSTTKLRVVFDASCKSSTGLSLNDILRVGPTIQRDLFSILVSFRLHAFAFIADIKQMYRQIKVSPQDANLQLILWRDSPCDDIKTFRLTTVTYGIASSSYLSIRCLVRLAELEHKNFSLASNVILNNFYVDDLIFSCDNL